MPRDGGGIYSFPSGGAAVSGDPISSTLYNTRWADILADANAARPISAGGTGEVTAPDALLALGGMASDALLLAMAALTTANNRFLKFTGVDTCAVFDLFGTNNSWSEQTSLQATLGSTGGNERVLWTYDVPDGNGTKLIVRALRRSNGSSHDTSALDMHRTVDGSNGAFVRWTSDGIWLGYNATEMVQVKTTGEVILYEVGPTNVNSAGARGSEVVTHDADYTFVLADAGKTMRKTTGSHTWTIPANASVAAPVGTIIPFSVKGGSVSLAITSDTLEWPDGAGTGTRTLTAPARGGIQKMTSTVWEVFGSGIT